MPNHVINELIFSAADADRILPIAMRGNDVDFSILLPIPINAWMGSVGSNHEKAFQLTALDWCRLNWGTKWNAYRQRPIERCDDHLILRFETAWRPPYGWLAALFNTLMITFDHNWLSEGQDRGVVGRFRWSEMEKDFGKAWEEEMADDAMHRHLHKLHWGVEEFEPEEASNV